SSRKLLRRERAAVRFMTSLLPSVRPMLRGLGRVFANHNGSHPTLCRRLTTNSRPTRQRGRYVRLYMSARRVLRPSSPSSRRRFPDIRRRTRIAPAKCAIEIREVAEPDLIRHLADGAIRKAWVAQHAVCAQEPLTDDECREGQAFVLEELVNITWCN